ncbi:membrane protein [Fervidicella metallireducens AeB]|uniref:Membrane protein n=1 Tax=Fervidicella metallireducens AeB TaxID=1403537 RepID=A0A017RVK2_9CLOT|nr:DUF4153 domain-containing protein [Fervidicella metallireducens]EYE88712.1 membrane protein [Fervidicella metallireducens AeB]
MKLNNLLKDVYTGVVNSLRRFPIAIGLSTSCVVMLIIISELQQRGITTSIEELTRITMIIALGIPLSLCIKLIFERKDVNKKGFLIISYSLSILFLVLYYYFLLKNFKMVPVTRYIGLNLVFYLAFLFIPYIKKENNFELYVLRIFTRFFTTIIYSVVLFAGLAAILFTIDKLLGVRVPSDFYYYTWLIVAGMFAPTFFLAGIPFKNEEFSLIDYPKLFKVLVLYIIMPLLTVYTLILYIYFAKIIVTREWPKGLVSHLVLWYSVITSMVLFFISPILNEKAWPRRFMEFFPKMLLPLITMMFISIGIRIRQYGVTENRYFVVALGIWVFFVMLYYSFNKKLRNIVLPVSLSIIMFLSVVGPISSYSISKYSQNVRLQRILNKNDMVRDKKIIPNKNISTEDKRQIIAILSYFDKNHSLNDVKYLPKNFKMENMEEIFGFKYEAYDYNNNMEYFFFAAKQNEMVLDIRDYDYLVDPRFSDKMDTDVGQLKIDFNRYNNVIKITQNGNEVYSKNLNEFVEVLLSKYGTNNLNKEILSKDLSFEEETNKVKIKFQFNNISGQKDLSTGKAEVKGAEFYFLVKIK